MIFFSSINIIYNGKCYFLVHLFIFGWLTLMKKCDDNLVIFENFEKHFRWIKITFLWKLEPKNINFDLKFKYMIWFSPPKLSPYVYVYACVFCCWLISLFGFFCTVGWGNHGSLPLLEGFLCEIVCLLCRFQI